jgi:WD40 repeat protein
VTSLSSRLFRVFVSSTFQDMHAERDHLNSVVWPELRNRCLRRGVELVAVDLRWGVTREDAEQAGAVAVCLAEIERCHYFVGLIGERYGWVPPPERVPAPMFEAARSKGLASALLDQCYAGDAASEPPLYRLRPSRDLTAEEAGTLVSVWESLGLPGAGRSITELEVRHALGMLPPGRTFFYVREAAGTPSAMPFSSVFHEGDPGRRERQLALTALVARRKGATARTYQVTFEGVRLAPALLPDALTGAERRMLSDGVLRLSELARAGPDLRRRVHEFGTAALGGLDAWGEQLQEDLWTAIERDLGRPSGRAARASRAARAAGDRDGRAAHEWFLLERTELFVGREDLVERLLGYVSADRDGDPLVVTGAPGSGKSALLAECARRCRERFPNAAVIPHFVGAAPGTTATAVTVRSLCAALIDQRGLAVSLPRDSNEVARMFSSILEAAAAKGAVVLVIDALNQLDADAGGHDLSWLPVSLPRGVRLIVSTLDGEVAEQVQRRVPETHLVRVESLPAKDRARLVRELLIRRGKRLTAAQLERLLDAGRRPDVGLPLYLTVAIEELSLFGQFAALDRRIDELPPTLTALFDQVLVRIEQDHGPAVTRLVLSLLAASRAGLIEAEVLDLLEREELGLTRAGWIHLYRSLQYYLRPMDEASGDGRLDFFHDQIRHAVFRRYFDMAAPAAKASGALVRAHRLLADYFDGTARNERRWDASRARPLQELPYHLAHAKRWRDLQAALTDFAFLQASADALGPQPLIEHYDFAARAGRAYPKAIVQGLRLLQETLRLSAHAVAPDPPQLPSQLVGRLQGTAQPTVQRVLSQAAQWRGAAWLRPRTACLSAPGGALQRVLIASGVGGHYGPGRYVAITPDGSRVVARAARRLGVWDVASGRLERTLVEDYDQAFAVTPDGRAVLVGLRGGTLQLRDLSSGKVTQTFTGLRGKLTAAAMSADGTRLITGNGVVKANHRTHIVVDVWDCGTGALLHRMAGHRGSRVNDVAITPDGAYTISVGEESNGFVWNLASGEVHHELPHGYFVVTSVAVLPDGHHAITADAKGTLTIWDIESGRPLYHFTCPRERTTRVTPYVTAITVAASGARTLFALMDETLRVWNPVSRRFTRVLTGHGDEVLDVGISADGARAVSASEDGTVRVWSPGERALPHPPATHNSRITALAITPDGTRVVSASDDHSIRVWDMRTGEQQAMLAVHEESVNAVFVTPDGRRLVSSSSDRMVKVSSLRTGHEERCFPGGRGGEWPTERLVVLTPDGQHLVNAAASGLLAMQRITTKATVWACTGDWLPRYVDVTPDGRLVLFCPELPDQDYVLVLDAKTGEQVHKLRARDQDPEIVLSMPDGARAVVGYVSGMVRVWNLRSGKVERTFRGHPEVVCALGVAGSGRFVVSGDRDGCLKVWDLAAATGHATLDGHTKRIWTLAMAPNGRLCATASDDHTLRVWDVESRREVAALLTEGAVWTCAFGADSRTIVSGGDSGRVHILDLVEPAHSSPPPH